VLQLPQDLFAIQNIIFRTRPDFIVEVGVAWAGSLLFYATLMEAIGGQGVIGLDTYIPDDLRERVGSFSRLSERIHLVQGSSTDREIVQKVKSIVGDSKKVMVNLDSSHTHAHVLQELRLYSPFVYEGHYLICSDTVLADIPVQEHRPRPWGPRNNPKTALEEFLREDDRFRVDHTADRALLLTCNPGGYLLCVKQSNGTSRADDPYAEPTNP
jgi:cephalosporin hydroxylase